MSSPPYTPIVRAGDWLVVSGQIGLGPDGLADGFAAQLRQALENLAGLVEGEGARLDQVAKVTVFLVDMGDYATLNEVYPAFLDERANGHRPSRSAVAVAALPFDAFVEVEAWVHAPA
jgi:2-iminobutanoate/2-iminopropanoate deaminase